MTEHDMKTGKELLEEDFIKKNPAWLAELELMVRTKQKAEIQALSSSGQQNTVPPRKQAAPSR
jgi:meiotic recombination protein SPO11